MKESWPRDLKFASCIDMSQLERLKKASSVFEALKVMEEILDEIHEWHDKKSENGDEVNISEIYSERIVKIADVLVLFGLEVVAKFYDRLLSDEFDKLRARFDHMDLAHFYINAGACYSAIGSDKKNLCYNKAKVHMEACEIGKYSLEHTMQLHANYHRTCAFDFQRQKKFQDAQKHVEDALHFLNRLNALIDPEYDEWIMQTQRAIYDLVGLKICILNHQRLFKEAFSNNTILIEAERFIKKYPQTWRRLFHLYGNLGVSLLSLGEYSLAIDYYKKAENLCLIYQKERIQESSYLQLIQVYQFFSRCLLKDNNVTSLYTKTQSFPSLGNAPQYSYLMFLVEWGMCLYFLLLARKKNLSSNKHFKRALERLKDKARIEDFKDEWLWFEEYYPKLSAENFDAITLYSAFPLFNALQKKEA